MLHSPINKFSVSSHNFLYRGAKRQLPPLHYEIKKLKQCQQYYIAPLISILRAPMSFNIDARREPRGQQPPLDYEIKKN